MHTGKSLLGESPNGSDRRTPKDPYTGISRPEQLTYGIPETRSRRIAEPSPHPSH